MKRLSMSIGNKISVGILGGGMQGCCLAIFFKKLGYRVTIIDQAKELISRASFNQEGKIHMGFIYANDPTYQTGFKLMNDCLHFATCLEDIVDSTLAWHELKSKKFIYLIPKDSLCSVDYLHMYFNKLENKYKNILESNPQLSYLGSKPENIFQSILIPKYVEVNNFNHCFQTEEVSISQSKLREIILTKLADKEILVDLNSKVISVSKNEAYHYTVHTSRGNKSFDFLVNCLWENQHIIDLQLGLNKKTKTNLRLKFGITSSYINELSAISSISMLTGAYGDFVNFDNKEERKMYFSWYPVGRHGMVIDQAIPNEWNDILNLKFSDQLFQNQINNQLAAFRKIFSEKFDFIDPKLNPGIIVAKGVEDIDNIQSELHNRNETPIFYSDGYLSISTGKFTSIPYNTYLASLKIRNIN